MDDHGRRRMPSRMMKTQTNNQRDGGTEAPWECHVGSLPWQTDEQTAMSRRVDHERIGIDISLYCQLKAPSLLFVVGVVGVWIGALSSFLVRSFARLEGASHFPSIAGVARCDRIRFDRRGSILGATVGKRFAKRDHSFPECFRNPSTASLTMNLMLIIR
jgi:hypothetical protein